MFNRDSTKRRATAATTHLAVSALVAIVVYFAVLRYFYPGPYLALAGARNLFLLIISVDVVIGPLLTFVVFKAGKSRRELRSDMLLICALQLGSLGYGLHIAYEARPVALVFEVDRFKLVSASEVKADELPHAPADYRELPTGQVWLLGARLSTPEQKLESIQLALQGFDLAQRPSHWQSYVAQVDQVLAASDRVDSLVAHRPLVRAHLLSLPGATEHFNELHFLPLSTRSGEWAVILNGRAEVLDFVSQN